MEQRLHPRIPVRPLCQARFSLGSNDLKNINVSNLSQEGCCLLVDARLAPDFEAKPALEGWKLTSPDLPRAKVKASVAWVRGQGLQPGQLMEVGIRFTTVPDKYAKELEEFVAYVKKTGIPPIDYSGMPA